MRARRGTLVAVAAAVLLTALGLLLPGARTPGPGPRAGEADAPEERSREPAPGHAPCGGESGAAVREPPPAGAGDAAAPAPREGATLLRVLARTPGGAPVEGARVEILSAERAVAPATTGPDGVASLGPRPHAPFRVLVRGGEAAGLSRFLDGAAPPPPLVIVVLEPALSVHGRVVDAGGAPVPGAAVLLRALEPVLRPYRGTSRADGEGRWRFDGVPAGALAFGAAVEAEGPGGTVAVLLPAGPGPCDPITIRLRPWRTLAGRCFDAYGSPLPEARIEAMGSGWDDAARTGEDGGFVLRTAGPGGLWLRVRQEEGLDVLLPAADPGEGPVVDLGTLRIPDRARPVSGRAVDGEGRGIGLAAVLLSVPGEFPVGLAATHADGDGEFVLPAVAGGGEGLRITAEGRGPDGIRVRGSAPVPSGEEPIRVEIPCGPRPLVVLALAEAGTGRPLRVPSAVVEIRTAAAPEPLLRVTGSGGRDGTWMLDPPEKGAFTIHVHAPGWKPARTEPMEAVGSGIRAITVPLSPEDDRP